MATDSGWRLSDIEPEPGYAPDGTPFPRNGYKLVRIERPTALGDDVWESVELEVPLNTPPIHLLAAAIDAMC